MERLRGASPALATTYPHPPCWRWNCNPPGMVIYGPLQPKINAIKRQPGISMVELPAPAMDP
jgi:hypothetical protein